jgi:YVTN family beta-propeller protein
MRKIIKGAALIGASLLLGYPAAAAQDGVVYVPEGSANAILVLDPASGEMVRRIEDVPEVHGLAAGPKGDFLVAGSLAEGPADGAPPKPEGMAASDHAAHHGKSAAAALGAGEAVSYVSIVRPHDGKITRRIEVPGAVHHTAVSPDGRYAVATHPSGDAISRIDLDTFEVTTITTWPLPNYAVISGDGTKIYVSNAGDDTVSELDAERGIVLRDIVVGPSPEHVVLAPDDERLYVANIDDGTVSVVALPNGEVVETFEIGGVLHGLDLTKDGKTLLVSAREANEVVAVDLESGTVKRQPLGPQPYHLTAGSGQIYVTSAEEPKLWVLDPDSLEVIREIPLQDIGHQVVVVAEPRA